MIYTAENLLIRPFLSDDPDVITEVSPAQAGWTDLHFQVRRLPKGSIWRFNSELFEMGMVLLSGSMDVSSSRGEWRDLGKRSSVFEGLPEALYLPPKTTGEAVALSDAEFALAWAPAQGHHPARRISQADIRTEIRGGGHASRHINSILPPGFGCERLVMVEVYTPAGNWSSYPPHKHDLHQADAQGHLLEADLEEIYFYKLNRPEGYAFQRVYTDETSPLHQAGEPIDAVVTAGDNGLVLVPEGYHPVACPPGYTAYYLNALAGSAQSLAASDDPHYSWIKETYGPVDPRVPIYPVNL